MTDEMEQTELLGKPIGTVTEDESVLVLSSNFSLPKFLERGCLLPPMFGEREDCEFLEKWKDEIPYRSGALPLSWSSGVEQSGRNMFPIGIRLKENRSVRSIQSKRKERFPMLLIEDMQELVFRNEEESSEFREWQFQEFDIESLGIRTKVDSSAFNGEEPATVSSEEYIDGCSDDSDVSERDLSLRDAFRRADMASGLLAVYAREAPAIPYWLERFSKLSAGVTDIEPDAQHVPTYLFRGMIRPGNGRGADLDGRLIESTIDVLVRYPLEAGWPATTILEEIYVTVRDELASVTGGRWSDELNAWYEHSTAVLEGEKEVRELTDDGSIVRRALLLLLLRGDMDSIEESIDRTRKNQSTIRIGTDVGALAMSLAGCRQGLRALDSRYKTNFQCDDPVRWMEYLGRYFIDRIDSRLKGVAKRKRRKKVQEATGPVFDVSYRKVDTLQGEWIFSIDGKMFLRRPARFDEGLLRLLHLGTDLGYVFDEYEDDKLVTEIRLDSGDSQRVVVELLADVVFDSREVRFWALVRPLKFVKKSEPTPKSGVFKKIAKEFLLQLLMRSGDDDMNCSFAVSRKRGGVIVKADQPFSTLDELEFEKRLLQVAAAANEILAPRS
jgi:hypothetical protein